MRKHKSSKGTSLLCSSCIDKGCIARDTELYQCKVCKQNFGAKRFDAVQLKNVKTYLSTKLECTDCARQIGQRIKELESRLKQSSRVCKCFLGNGYHKEKCPLTRCYSGEKRWPGSDKMQPSGKPFISAEDRQFLDNLNPKPKWWTKAWGKR